MTALHFTDRLEPFRKILEEIEVLDVEWTVSADGLGGIRSTNDRCPLEEVNLHRNGSNQMPSYVEIGLTIEQRAVFVFSADNSVDAWPDLREAIGKATKTSVRMLKA